MHVQDWYEQYEWARADIPPGTYRIRLPVPGSNNRIFAEQQQLLIPGETVAPVALVAAALLCIAQSGRPDPLNRSFVRCAGTTAHGIRVALGWCVGWLYLDRDWNDVRHVDLWLASAGTSEPCPSSF